MSKEKMEKDFTFCEQTYEQDILKIQEWHWKRFMDFKGWSNQEETVFLVQLHIQRQVLFGQANSGKKATVLLKLT